MAYVPGYQYDIFISYAHGDDRDWINRFIDRLKPEIKRRLGIETNIWIDGENLRRSRDFQKEIPESVKSSALFLFLPSPTYIRSEYCVFEECRTFKETQNDRRDRFSGTDFVNEQFALRCPILPVENNEHWQLFPGLTDIPFCSETDRFSIGSPEFDASFGKLSGELVTLLRRMRNQSTAVFLYPPRPGFDLKEAHRALYDELAAQSYRLLPDRWVNLDKQLQEASLSVFLLGDAYDDTAVRLTEIASQQAKPWVVWNSPVVGQKATVEQIGFCRYLEQLDSPTKTYLSANISPGKLKEEVLALLRPSTRLPIVPEGKPRVYLIFNSRDPEEKVNAGLIKFHFKKEFHFDLPDDPGQHTLLLTNSDGVLVVWGSAEEDWCAREFEAMMKISRRAQVKGLCVFDPKETKAAVLEQIRGNSTDLQIAEQFGRFDPGRMEKFFNPIRRH
jgi:TIR domain